MDRVEARVSAGIQGFVSPWVDALADQLLAQVGVPIVLDLVVGAPGDPSRYQRPPKHYILR